MQFSDKIAASPERMKGFQRERLETEVTESICQLMEEQGLTRADLARRLGKSRAYVTKLLREGNNMTLNTVSDVFFALGRSPRVLARPVSMWSPTLLVVEVPRTSRMAVPTRNIEYTRITPESKAPVSFRMAT